MGRQLSVLGSRYRLVDSPVASLAFVQGSPAKVELPNTLLNRRVVLRLTGNLVIGVANATILDEAPLPLIRSIAINCDGTQKVLMAANARLLFRNAHYSRRKQGELTAPSGVVGTRAFAATIVLDHETVDMMDPSETLFDPRRYKKVELVVNWGFATDIATAGGGGTIAIDTANTSIDVFVKQVVVGAGQVLFTRILSMDEKAVVATVSRLDDLKIPQAGLLRRILFLTTRDGTRVDDIINTIQLISDTTLKHRDELKWTSLQRDNVYDFQLDGGSAVGQPITGYAALDLVENGSWASPINTAALNQTFLRLNVTRTSGSELIQVLYDFGEPARAAA